MIILNHPGYFSVVVPSLFHLFQNITVSIFPLPHCFYHVGRPDSILEKFLGILGVHLDDRIFGVFNCFLSLVNQQSRSIQIAVMFVQSNFLKCFLELMFTVVYNESSFHEPVNCTDILHHNPLGLVFPAHSDDSLGHLLHHLHLDILRHPGHVLLLELDVEGLDQELDGAALEEHGEEDHDEGGGEEELPVPGLLPDDHGQGEAHRAPQTAIGHDELLLIRDLLHPTKIDQEGKQKSTREPEHQAEEDCGDNEACVKVMLLFDQNQSEEQEDDAVRGRGQRLGGALDGRVGRGGDILQGVSFGSYPVCYD